MPPDCLLILYQLINPDVVDWNFLAAEEKFLLDFVLPCPLKCNAFNFID
jgi:hypothetical protein